MKRWLLMSLGATLMLPILAACAGANNGNGVQGAGTVAGQPPPGYPYGYPPPTGYPPGSVPAHGYVLLGYPATGAPPGYPPVSCLRGTSPTAGLPCSATLPPAARGTRRLVSPRGRPAHRGPERLGSHRSRIDGPREPAGHPSGHPGAGGARHRRPRRRRYSGRPHGGRDSRPARSSPLPACRRKGTS